MMRLLFILIGVAPLAVHAVASEPPTVELEELLERFKQMPGLEARFREEKQIALLAAPLISEGVLHFAPPARLARHTLTPERSSLLFDGRTLRFGDGRMREEVDLEANPVARDYVNSFLLILEGDREALLRSWRIELSGRAEAWNMTLRPLSEQIRKTMREMILQGSGAVVQRMKIVETTSDETVTTFSHVNPARRYSQAEIDRLFRIPPR